MNENLKQKKVNVDFCVVGGGMSGMFAAISAARRGAKVALVNDRPVLGGNASSEIRMWALGAHGDNNRETGIFEEILCENMRRNPLKNYSIWDSILYEKVRFEPNIELFLNASCFDAEVGDGCIKSVTCWQLTTYTMIKITADIFADCSGDSILAPLCGAAFRTGREAASEYGESLAPQTPDRNTMGMSLLLQGRKSNRKVEFTAPKWAVKLTEEQLKHRHHDVNTGRGNFWWIELGGDRDGIADTEEVRDELLALSFGVWDHIKNGGSHDADDVELDWAGFLPGKRESRRYIGAHVLTQQEVLAGGYFDDLVAYGGWSLDDHFSDGFWHDGPLASQVKTPEPFGIPYRCLYSNEIKNLMFAGRNISTTHIAISSTRVIATCAIIGQAVGTAAALCRLHGILPGGITGEYVRELQNALMQDDCYLPRITRKISPLSLSAALSADSGDPEPLRNGIDRPVGENDNGWTGNIGDSLCYAFEKPEYVRSLRVIFDSDLNRDTIEGGVPGHQKMPMTSRYINDMPAFEMPKTLVKSYTAEYKLDGVWHVFSSDDDNYQRFVTIPLGKSVEAVRMRFDRTRGSQNVHLFSFEVC